MSHHLDFLKISAFYGNSRLQELRLQRPAEIEAAQAALSAQMAKEAAAKAQADKEFAANSILYGTYKE